MVAFLCILLLASLLLLALLFVIVSRKELKMEKLFSLKSAKLISKHLLTLIKRNVTSTELLIAMLKVIQVFWRVFRVFILILVALLIILLIF